MTGVANNGIATTLSYNGAGQLTGESYAGGTLTGLSVSKTYDAKLRLSQLRAPNLVTNAFAYNGTSGRLTTVTHGGYTATYGYTTNSPLVGQVLFKQSATNRMTTTKTYDKLNRMTGMVSTPSGGGQLPFSYGASYNEANQRITVTMNNGSYWIYEYDTLETVLERIGKPLRFAVLIKNTNGVWYTPKHSKDSAILSQWNDEDSFLHLFYSEPGPDNDIYRIREVLIEKGIVVEIRTGIYTD